MVPVSAFLIDKFSTRALFFGATLVFALGTLLCAAAPDFLFLIIGRVLQAAGSGVLMPLVSVVPMLVFPVEKRGTAMGMAGIVMSAGPAVGPVVGGAVIDTPGIKGFGLIDIDEAELWHYFPEMMRVAPACRFYNCTHTHEPGCAVTEAVKAGEIAWPRYESYLKIRDEDEKYRK